VDRSRGPFWTILARLAGCESKGGGELRSISWGSVISHKRHILIIEDDPVIQHVLQATLEYGGFTYEPAETAHRAISLFQKVYFDAILLNLGLPDMDGNDLIKTLRGQSDLPILVVSGQADEQRRIASLDLGADDFVAKPFLPGELLARIRASLRRRGSVVHTIRIGEVEFDPAQPFVRSGREAMGLTKAEHALLAALARRPSNAVSTRELTEAVWGTYDERKERNLRVLINQLRRKIEPHPKYPAYIISHHGIGYRLNT
jgi:two-component system KDP operon response regulator KdpE